jgi:aspartyl-tRNA(Asn)/glutamyl-tRNA(Gln) amidotransferase subunit C
MKSESIDVSYVATLARLKLTPEETTTFQTQLKQVLSYVEQLGELKLDGIEPTAHAAPQVNVFRSDEVTDSLPVEEAVQNAPQKLNDLFRVPKVVE